VLRATPVPAQPHSDRHPRQVREFNAQALPGPGPGEAQLYGHILLLDQPRVSALAAGAVERFISASRAASPGYGWDKAGRRAE
jgi:hypothetical protein